MSGDVNVLVLQSYHRPCGITLTFRETMNNSLFAVYVPNKSHVEAHCPKHLIQ